MHGDDETWPIERRLTVPTQERYLQTTMFDGER